MEEVIIHTRDVNGLHEVHLLTWDEVCSYVTSSKLTDEDEILMIVVEDSCIYSAIFGKPITWDDVTGFFA